MNFFVIKGLNVRKSPKTTKNKKTKESNFWEMFTKNIQAYPQTKLDPILQKNIWKRNTINGETTEVMERNWNKRRDKLYTSIVEIGIQKHTSTENLGKINLLHLSKERNWQKWGWKNSHETYTELHSKYYWQAEGNVSELFVFLSNQNFKNLT